MKRFVLLVFVVVSLSLSLFATGTVTVSSPLNGSTVTSPVAIHATYSGTAKYMKLWIDHVAIIAQNNTSTFSYNATLAPGAHLLEVQAQDATSLVVVTTPVNITVTSSTTQSVTITNPAPNSTVTSPFNIHATYSGTASYMKLWVDHTAIITENNTSVFDYNATLANGSHLLEVQAADATTGVISTGSETVNVGTSTTPQVTIVTPVANSTVTSPVAIHATYNRTATYMKLWVDHVAVIALHTGSVFDYSVSLALGTHLIEVQAADASTGVVYTTPENITVANSAGVTVSPATATVVAGESQQFSVSGATGTVTWSTTSGTITQSGLFTAGTAPGTATISAADSGTGTTGTAKANVVALAISPNPATVALGGSITLTANAPATWAVTSGGGTISNTSTASTTATYTAPSSSGSATVTATDANNTAVTATDTVTTGALVITPSVANTIEGQTQQFTANAPVSWSASCGAIDQNGLFTAPNVVEDCTITATQTSGSATATAIDHITAPNNQGLSYTMWKNDLLGTGQQRNEILLTPSNVNSTKFGVKFSVSLDGMVFAQPLFLSNVNIKGVTHNGVVYVATEHDSVYAFDADVSGSPLWKKSLIMNGGTTVPQSNVGSTVPTEIGITGTPVIDPVAGTLYVVAETLESGVYIHRLHALDVTSGAERSGSPKVIAASGFASKEQLQRCGLTLANGNIYICFGSQGDHAPYHGWVMAYSATTLAQTAVYNVSPGGTAGGIWMSGAAPTVDSSGNIYVTTGNGSFNGSTQLSMSIIKLSPSLKVLDWFAPFNAVSQSLGDKDVGSGGPLLVPDQSGAFPHELIECGKLPQVYVINRDNMGHQGSTSDSQIIQELTNVVGGTSGTQAGDHCFTTPAYWQGNLYFTGNNDVIKQFALNPSTGLMASTPTAKGTFIFAFPGGQPVVSSNGSSNGIVWVVDRGNPAHLHAFDATNVSKSLYTSGSLVFEKFAVPTVVEGHVFVAGQNKLFVFGLL